MKLSLPVRRKRLFRMLSVLFALLAYVAIAASISARIGLQSERCKAMDGWLYCGGEKFLVKGVGWDPTRPGKLPWDGGRSASLVDRDFRAIRDAGFNTIRTWEALTPEELVAAETHRLAVLQGIWIDPAGNFEDPAFRSESLSKVERIARYSRNSPVVLAYLVMNEPAPDHLLRIGLDASRRFLLDVSNTIRREDPGALVTFSSWPGLEFFDVPDLDLVAVNLYPFRPRVLIDAVGYDGMVSLWKTLLARGRPLLVTEYGISVAPTEALVNRPGGATEAEQARELPRLAEAIVRSGGAGSAAFMWIDGWWKNADGLGDELSHDPQDGEEWFGLRTIERLGDEMGRPRPALDAMRRWNRAVLTSPSDGGRDWSATDGLEIEIYVEDEVSEPILRAAFDGTAPIAVPVARSGSWIRGHLSLPGLARGLHITLWSGDRLIGEWQRRLRPDRSELSLDLHVATTDNGTVMVARLQHATGGGVPGVPLRLAVSDASHRFDRFEVVTTDQMGEARLAVELPPAPAHLVAVAALREGDDEPPLAMAVQVLGGGVRP